MNSDELKCISVRFNQECDLFSCCLEEGGVQIFNVKPLSLLRTIEKSTIGTVRICEMLRRTQFVALVGNKPNSLLNPNSVNIYDLEHHNIIFTLTFNKIVLDVKLATDKVIVIMQDKITIAKLSKQDIKKSHDIPTCDNPYASCAVTSNPATSERNFVVYPSTKTGTFSYMDLNFEKNTASSPISIKAHKSKIASLSLNNNSILLASASEKGTLFRIWDLKKKKNVYEFRRGMENAKIFNISFSPLSKYFITSSDKTTVHIFTMRNNTLTKLMPNNSTSTLKVTSEQFSACGFISNFEVIALDANGMIFKYLLDADGNLTFQESDNFLNFGRYQLV